MSEVQAYFGEWTLAEQVLRQNMDFQLQIKPSSKVALQFSNSLIELHHQRELYEETVEIGERVLNTWGTTLPSYEVLRAVFFLVNACYNVDEEIKGFKLVDLYTNMIGVTDWPSQCVMFFIMANRHYINGKYQEAMELFEKGMELSLRLPPSTYLIVSAKYWLGNCYKNLKRYDQTKATFIGVLHLYMVHFPKSPQAISCIDYCLLLSL